MPRLTEPSLKMKLFAKKYVENNGNGVKAAMESYKTGYENAKSIAYQNLDKPMVQQEVQRILDKSGLNLDVASDKLLQSIDAGLGQKATNADAVRALQFVFKLHNAIPEKTSKHLSLRMSHNEVIKKNITEVATSARQINLKTTKLLEDLGI